MQRLPGYTGYKPAHLKEEEERERALEATAMIEADAGPRVPGYQGYVPSIKSENVFGGTYGKTTQGQRQGAYVAAGFDTDDRDRYTSVANQNYGPQMQQHVFGRQAPDFDPNVAKQGGLHMTYEEVRAALQQGK